MLTILTACDGGGGSSSGSSPNDSLQQDDDRIAFTASKLVMNEGDTTLLSWDASRVAMADAVEISPNIGVVALQGSQEISPTEDTQYLLKALSDGVDVASRSLSISVRPNAAVNIKANITEGPAPLTVRFTPIVQSNTAINRFYWEFEGDGGDYDGGLGVGENGFDPIRISNRWVQYDVTGRDITHTYSTPGTYPAKVRVWDALGNQKEATLDITVTNGDAGVSVVANSTNGTAPFDVRFAVSAYDEQAIQSLQFDYDGDGVVDEEKAVNGRQSYRANHSHVYTDPGTYQPILNVVDSTGSVTTFELEHLKIDAVAVDMPLVTVSLNTRTGQAPLEVTHVLSRRNITGSTVVSYEWDFDGDGVNDYVGDDARVNFTYTKAGLNSGTVTALTDNGLRITNRFAVNVQALFLFSVDTPSINPNSQTATFSVNSTSEVEFELAILSADGLHVKSVLANSSRLPGDFTASWDGKNDAGVIQAPGDYYVVVNATIDGKKTTIDIRENTGGDIFYPNGWGGSRRCSGSTISECGLLVISDNALEPFADKPINFDITSPHNSRMTAYVTLIGSDNFAATTFFRSRVMSAGDTRLDWFGTGSDGKLLPFRSDNGYLPAIYGITLAANSIVLNHQTELSDLSVAPSILHPLNGSEQRSKSAINFNLSHESDVTLTIDNVTKGVNVYSKTYFDVASGGNTEIDWDGRDNLGRLVGPGGYVLTVSATDSYGQTTIPQKKMFKVEY